MRVQVLLELLTMLPLMLTVTRAMGMLGMGRALRMERATRNWICGHCCIWEG